MQVVYKSECEINVKHYTNALATGISHYLLNQYNVLFKFDEYKNEI